MPEALKAFVIGTHHNLPLAGHGGARRTIKAICNNYYWKGMSGDIRRWVAACQTCTRKRPRPIHVVKTEAILALSPNEIWAVDIIPSLTETDNGNRHILTMIDMFTRWPIAVPIRDRTSKTIMEALYEHLLTQKGCPVKIISDQGRELISEAVKSLCELWGIRKINTGGYNPRGNSSIERFHKYFLAALSIVQNRSSPNWDEYIPAILFSYRTSTNDATQHSPFFLEHGRDARLPLDLNINIDLNREQSGNAMVIANKLKTAWEIARKTQFEAAKKNADRTARVYHPLTLNKGDFVYVWERRVEAHKLLLKGPRADETVSEKELREKREKVRLSRKLTNPWTGPFEVLERLNERYFKINVRGSSRSYNVNRLSKHNAWDDVNTTTTAWDSKRLDIKIPESEDRRDLQIGDFVIFPMTMSDDNPWPFGLGQIQSVSDPTDLGFQWIGNSTYNAKGVMSLGWFQPKDSKVYYATTKLHASHQPLTNKFYETYLTQGQLTFRTEVLLNRQGRLTREAKNAVKNDLRIAKREDLF